MAGRVCLFGALALVVLSAHVNAIVVPMTMATRQVSQPRFVVSRMSPPQTMILLREPGQSMVRTVTPQRFSPLLQTLLQRPVQTVVSPVGQRSAQPTTIFVDNPLAKGAPRPPRGGAEATSTSTSGVTITFNGAPKHGGRKTYVHEAYDQVLPTVDGETIIMSQPAGLPIVANFDDSQFLVPSTGAVY